MGMKEIFFAFVIALIGLAFFGVILRCWYKYFNKQSGTIFESERDKEASNSESYIVRYLKRRKF